MVTDENSYKANVDIIWLKLIEHDTIYCNLFESIQYNLIQCSTAKYNREFHNITINEKNVQHKIIGYDAGSYSILQCNFKFHIQIQYNKD